MPERQHKIDAAHEQAVTDEQAAAAAAEAAARYAGTSRTFSPPHTSSAVSSRSMPRPSPHSPSSTPNFNPHKPNPTDLLPR